MHVKIPHDHFLRRIKTDYADFQTAIIREFLQNSVDASATRVDVAIEDEHPNTRLIVTDNGRGCSGETITDRLLTLGGTYKDGEAIGGFGVAKEVLFFAWPSWRIRTKNCEVSGGGPEYDIYYNMPFQGGFEAEILLLNISADSFTSQCETYLKKCDVNPAVFVNGEQVRSRLPLPPRARRILSSGRVYVLPSSGDLYLHVRHHGVEMFRMYTGYDEKNLILELEGKSIDLLTSNRDGFRQESHRTEVSDFLGQLRTDKKTALRKSSEVDYFVTAVMPSKSGYYGQSVSAAGLGTSNIVMLESNGMLEDHSLPCALPLLPLGNPFSLHVRGDSKILSRAKGFLPRKRARKLACYWDTIVRGIAFRLETMRFECKIAATGFVFDEERKAEWRCEDDRHHVLLNPLSLRGKFLVEEMIDNAIHELAHVLNGPYHNEEWAIKESAIRHHMRPCWKELKKELKSLGKEA